MDDRERRQRFGLKMEERRARIRDTFGVAVILRLVVIGITLALAYYGHHWGWAVSIGLGVMADAVFVNRGRVRYDRLVQALTKRLLDYEEYLHECERDAKDDVLLINETLTQERADEILKRYALRIEAAESREEREEAVRAYEDLADLLGSRGYLTGSWQQHVRGEGVREDDDLPIGHV